MATWISALHALLLAVCVCAVASQFAEGPAPPRLIVPGAAPVPDQPGRPRFLSGRQRRPQALVAQPQPQPTRQAYLPTPPADLVEGTSKIKSKTRSKNTTPPSQSTLPPRPVEEEPEEYDEEADAPTPPPGPRPARPQVRPQEQQPPQFRQQRPIAVQVSSPVGISVADIPVTPARQVTRPAAFRPERRLPVARQQQSIRPQEQLPQQIFRQQQQPSRPAEIPPIFRQPPQQLPQQILRQQQQQQQTARPTEVPQIFRQPSQPPPQQISRQQQQQLSRPTELPQIFRPSPQQISRQQQQQPSRPAVEAQQFRPAKPAPIEDNIPRQQFRRPVVQQPSRPRQHVKQPAVEEDDEDEEVDVPRQHFRQPVQQSAAAARPQQRPTGGQIPNKAQRVKKPVAQVLRKYREDNPDGSITWGYENDDGSFKEETIGVDCVVSGKYGYVDPDGVRREYTYSSGTPCDKTLQAEEEDVVGGGGGIGAGQGYMDYESGEFVLPGGQTVNMRNVNKHKSRRPTANYGK